MCPPLIAALPAIMTAATVASGAVSVYGGIQAAKAQSAGLKYQAQLDEVNAINADRAARDALERGELDAVKHGREVRELRGRQINAQAAQGLELGFGSPLAILQDTDLLAAEDRAAIYENANREAEGYRINATNARASAAGNRAQAANTRSAAVLEGASTVLNTVTQVGGIWAKYGKKKP